MSHAQCVALFICILSLATDSRILAPCRILAPINENDYDLNLATCSQFSEVTMKKRTNVNNDIMLVSFKFLQYLFKTTNRTFLQRDNLIYLNARDCVSILNHFV